MIKILRNRLIDAFHSKRQIPRRPQGDWQYPEEEGSVVLGILCIVCNDTIPELEIEAHSQICTTSVLVKEEEKEVDRTIEKFCAFLDRNIINSKSSDNANSALMLFTSLLKKSLICPSISEREELIAKVEEIIDNSKGRSSVIMYLERGYSLMVQKNNFSKTKEELSEKINLYKKRAYALENSLKKLKLNEIQSQISSAKSDSYSVSSFSSDHERNDCNFQESDLQRYFFSLCLSEKLNFKSSHPAQKVSIPALFKEAAKLKPEQWKAFIANELKQPYKWLRNNRRPSRANFNFFEPIPEEIS